MSNQLINATEIFVIKVKKCNHKLITENRTINKKEPTDGAYN